jgi:hypothetical protein
MRSRRRQRRAAAAALTVLVFMPIVDPSSARAAAPEGTVVAIDSGDLVLDIGAAGVRIGQVVELWRPMRVRHPVTGKVLVDRFKIGNVRLVEVQNVLSLAKVDGTTTRAPAAGDQVVVPEPPSAKTTTAPAQVVLGAQEKVAADPQGGEAGRKATPKEAAAPAATIFDPEARELSDLFVRLEGTDPTTRAHAYGTFVRAWPRSRFAKVLREEMDALTRPTKVAEAPYTASFDPLDRLRPGVPQRFAIELDPRFVGAVVHVRRRGATAYRSIPMASVGPRYWAATLPGDAINEPGTDYFVEGVPKTGAPFAIVGSAETPKESPVDRRPLTGKRPGTLAQLTLASELASFNLKKANDFVFQTEGAFGWRMQDTGVRAIRSGFGVLRGQGGSLADLDQLGQPPRDVGLTYGWVEVELATSKTFGVLARPIVGLREGGVSGGAQGFFRIGSDLATNLTVGGEVLGTVGLRGVVQLEWRTIPRVPLLLRSEVTNQPAGVGGDIGARAIAQVGYEIVRDLSIAARLSYQGRTIAHSGPGAGAGVSYQW